MGNHEWCVDCNISNNHTGRPCDPADIAKFRSPTEFEYTEWLTHLKSKQPRTLVVWKYELPPEEFPRDFMIFMTDGKIVHVNTVSEKPYIWVECDVNSKMINRRFRVIETGEHLPCADRYKYVGTYMRARGDLIFHVYEMTS